MVENQREWWITATSLKSATATRFQLICNELITKVLHEASLSLELVRPLHLNKRLIEQAAAAKETRGCRKSIQEASICAI